MTRTEAHELLDAAQAGDDVTHADINLALIVTGDVEDDAPIVQIHRPVGSWERATLGVLLNPAQPFDGIAA